MALEHFLKLENEKQKAIVQASLDEFVEYGYDLASTNRIVERAGIGKGTLFKYFSSKEELFCYVVELSYEKVLESFEMPAEGWGEDLFETLKAFVIKKVQLLSVYPKEFALFQMMAINNSNPLYQRLLKEYIEKGWEFYHQTIAQLNRENLRSGLSPEKAFQHVRWTIEGYQQQVLNQIGNKPVTSEILPTLLADMDSMFELLKYGIYR
jgi:AcrR family transcriptional regulator